MFQGADQLAQLIDHTMVRPDATFDDLFAACENAKKYGFHSVVVNGWHVARTREILTGTLVRVCAVAGFPLGASTTTVKIVEAMEAMKNGASEIDFVINIGMVKSGRFDMVEVDIKNIIAMTPKKVHKIILETGYLTREEIIRLCEIAIRTGAEFIKTSTGFGPRGATVDDVRLIKTVVSSACRIKASGGIRDLSALTNLIAAGAERIGTSAGPAIMEEYYRLQ
jgi:deoxyribose-phosphate aldolase